MTKETKTWEEEFDEDFDDYWWATFNPKRGEEIKQFIKQTLAKDKPIGISQWKEIGKKYGYWDYFREKVIEEATKVLRKGKIEGHWMGETNASCQKCEWNLYIEQTINKLKELNKKESTQ